MQLQVAIARFLDVEAPRAGSTIDCASCTCTLYVHLETEMELEIGEDHAASISIALVHARAMGRARTAARGQRNPSILFADYKCSVFTISWKCYVFLTFSL